MAADAPTVPKSMPVLLSLLAGYVDSCTFLALFGLFVAQVTGSFVLAGTQLVAHENGGLVKLTAIPAFFLACVVVTVMVRRARRNGRSALAGNAGPRNRAAGGTVRRPADRRAVWRTRGAIRRMREPVRHRPRWVCRARWCGCSSKDAPSTNVMTTNTSQLAVDATELLLTARARRRAPDDAALAAEHARLRERLDRLWPVVLGFLTGTIVGALAFAQFGVWSVLAPIALAATLAVWALRGVSARASA